jgi:hypothetical protein
MSGRGSQTPLLLHWLLSNWSTQNFRLSFRGNRVITHPAYEQQAWSIHADPFVWTRMSLLRTTITHCQTGNSPRRAKYITWHATDIRTSSPKSGDCHRQPIRDMSLPRTSDSESRLRFRWRRLQDWQPSCNNLCYPSHFNYNSRVVP